MKAARRPMACKLTVKELLTEWFQGVKHKIKESTAPNYRMKAEKHIIPGFGEIQADCLTSDQIYTFIKAKQEVGLSNRYISDILMKSIYKYGVRTYHIDNPMKGITMPKKRSPEIKLLDSTEQQMLQQYIAQNQNRATLGVTLSIVTGIRIGELCALQWKDIDLEKCILTVRKNMQRIQLADGVRKTKLIITEPKSE